MFRSRFKAMRLGPELGDGEKRWVGGVVNLTPGLVYGW
jgi:hypothetical protein